MKNLVKNFRAFINESIERSKCCSAEIVDGKCLDCGEEAESKMEFTDSMDGLDSPEGTVDLTLESKKPNRKSVLKAADEKYPNLSAKDMKKTLGKMKGSDFKSKAKKYFGWADDPEAAAASFIRKATKKEPRDA